MQTRQSHLIRQRNAMGVSIDGFQLEILRGVELSEESIEFAFIPPYYREIYVLEGKFSIVTAHGVLRLSGGDLCFIAPNVRTQYAYDKTRHSRVIVIAFQTELKSEKRQYRRSSFDIRSRLNAIADKKLIVIRSHPDLGNIINDIRVENDANSCGKDVSMASLYFHFILRGMRFIGIDNVQDEEEDRRKNFIMDLIIYLKNNIHNKVTLTDISKTLYVSPRHISRFVREELGISFRQFLEEIKYYYTKKYMLESGLSAEELAEKIGYGTPRAVHNILQKYEHHSDMNPEYLSE